MVIDMTMNLNSGNKITVRDIKKQTVNDASVIKSYNDDSIFVLFSGEELGLGEVVELELPYKEDSVYIFRAKVIEVNANKQFTIQLAEAPKLVQRRASQRIPANNKAEYILSSENQCGKDLSEGLLLNISKTGALLAAKETLPVKASLFLTFDIYIPDTSGQKTIPTGIMGKIIREQKVEKDPKWYYSYGVRFDKPFTVFTGSEKDRENRG